MCHKLINMVSKISVYIFLSMTGLVSVCWCSVYVFILALGNKDDEEEELVSVC